MTKPQAEDSSFREGDLLPGLERKISFFSEKLKEDKNVYFCWVFFKAHWRKRRHKDQLAARERKSCLHYSVRYKMAKNDRGPPTFTNETLPHVFKTKKIDYDGCQQMETEGLSLKFPSSLEKGPAPHLRASKPRLLPGNQSAQEVPAPDR